MLETATVDPLPGTETSGLGWLDVGCNNFWWETLAGQLMPHVSGFFIPCLRFKHLPGVEESHYSVALNL